jgi:hypothetical protein
LSHPSSITEKVTTDQSSDNLAQVWHFRVFYTRQKRTDREFLHWNLDSSFNARNHSTFHKTPERSTSEPTEKVDHGVPD